eukprot:CAMPEP_0204844494 /NCGR_PEP_ID=MMETSP1347-20130617/249_1 /ASSEMBLY_ACC=CAM_ASM_000690 /TAXON_ID=215587 /ORGANISM="Aplanochytrium stocchinoi, Strain GSBS06" /LENGTH=99 /DNA_ID=CAMNT_0051983869 /DNA_START=161 /DNA_END=460 /DNA_ORIENTATION=-
MKASIGDVPLDQAIHIKFEDFVTNNTKIVKKVLEYNNLKLTTEMVQKINKYLKDNPREGAKAFEYSLSTFDLTEDDIVEKYTFYTDMDIPYWSPVGYDD